MESGIIDRLVQLVLRLPRFIPLSKRPSNGTEAPESASGISNTYIGAMLSFALVSFNMLVPHAMTSRMQPKLPLLADLITRDALKRRVKRFLIVIKVWE